MTVCYFNHKLCKKQHKKKPKNTDDQKKIKKNYQDIALE